MNNIYCIYCKCGNKNETIFRNEESVEILEPLGLIDNIEER